MGGCKWQSFRLSGFVSEGCWIASGTLQRVRFSIMKRKNIKKIIHVFLVFQLFCYSTFTPLALAVELEEDISEDILQTEDQNQSVNNEDDLNDQEEQNLLQEDVVGEVPGESLSVDNEADEEPVGEFNPEDCLDCVDNDEIQIDNETDLETDLTSDANTGGNTVETYETDSNIDTGDAQASGEVFNDVSFEVDLEGEEECLDDCVVIEIENETSATTSAQISANSGENEVDSQDSDTQVITGDSLAYAQIMNLLNTTYVNSNFQLYSLSLTSNAQGNIYLSQVWDEAGQKVPGLVNDGSWFLLDVNNITELNNNVSVIAVSGKNVVSTETGNIFIISGDASAAANVYNLVNSTFVNSVIFFGTINIFETYEGDIVVPRPDKFLRLGDDEVNSISFGSDASIINNALVETDTGNNTATASGSNQIETGDATSVNNIYDYANFTSTNDWFFLLLNNLGIWNGYILNWSEPGSVEVLNENTSSILFEAKPTGNVVNSEGIFEDDVDEGNFLVNTNNQAIVKNTIEVSASTGGNQAEIHDGITSITTGVAKAISNLFNFININTVSSNWFVSLINIFGNWTGNLIFAYPDVDIKLTALTNNIDSGEEIEYRIDYRNIGYDVAENTVVEIEMPSGMKFVSCDYLSNPTISGNKLIWNVGTLEAGSQGSISIKLKIQDGFLPETNSNSLLSKIFKTAHAAENIIKSQITVLASVTSTDPDTNLANNYSFVTTNVNFSYITPDENEKDKSQENNQEAGSENETDHRQPVLSLKAKNNVNVFVYPGDTITFDLTLANSADVVSHDTYLYNEVYNSQGEVLSQTILEIEEIKAKSEAQISFGMIVPETISGDEYYTQIQAFGVAPDGAEVSSNQEQTKFKVNIPINKNLIENTLDVEAKTTDDLKDILGTSSDIAEKQLPWVYVLLFGLSALWLTNKTYFVRKRLL